MSLGLKPAQTAAILAPAGQQADGAVHYRSIRIDGLEIFYREAGPLNAPAVLLLHGFPTSSSMFRNLIPLVAGRYRLIAPDYPGFGNSSMPPRTQFNYTFALTQKSWTN